MLQPFQKPKTLFVEVTFHWSNTSKFAGEKEGKKSIPREHLLV